MEHGDRLSGDFSLSPQPRSEVADRDRSSLFNVNTSDSDDEDRLAGDASFDDDDVVDVEGVVKQDDVRIT